MKVEQTGANGVTTGDTRPVMAEVEAMVEVIAGQATTMATSLPPEPSRVRRTVRPLVHICTDGACSGNPGPGGWGALMEYGKHERTLSGYAPCTTNNRMEMLAVIRALEALKRPCRVALTTDSQYVKNGITQWIHQWKRRGWRKADGKAVLNIDLWQQLDALCHQHEVEWHWVRGHAGHPKNEMADQLAREGIQQGRSGLLAPDPSGTCPASWQEEK